jgi:hypothetical protein
MSTSLDYLMVDVTISVEQATGSPGKPWHGYITNVTAPEERLPGNRHGEWVDVVGSTEDEARAKACDVYGAELAYRLNKELGPTVVPARTMPSKRTFP